MAGLLGEGDLMVQDMVVLGPSEVKAACIETTLMFVPGKVIGIAQIQCVAT